MDGDLAVAELLDFLVVDVDAGDLVTEVRQKGCGPEAHVSGTDDRYIH